MPNTTSFPTNGERLLTVLETAEELRLSRSATYRLLASCDLDSVRIGGNRRVRHSDLMRYIGSLRTVCESVAPPDTSAPVPECPDTGFGEE